MSQNQDQSKVKTKKEIDRTASVKDDKVKDDSPLEAFQEEPKTGTGSAPVQTAKVLSSMDSEVSDLVAESPVDIDALDITDTSQFNLLELPEECYEYHGKRYRFRWIAKNPQTSARLRSSVWVLCTRTNAPFLKSSRFKSHGAVEQAGMLLAFCSEKTAQIREQQPADRSAQLVKHYTKDLPNHREAGFYKPEDSGDESEDGLVEGVDF